MVDPEKLCDAIAWLCSEMPVGWQELAEGEGRLDVVEVVRQVLHDSRVEDVKQRVTAARHAICKCGEEFLNVDDCPLSLGWCPVCRPDIVESNPSLSRVAGWWHRPSSLSLDDVLAVPDSDEGQP